MGDGTPLGGGEEGGYEEMSYLVHFILLALAIGAAQVITDHIYAGAYKRCFRERRREGFADGLWCKKPLGFSNCKDCPHYHFHN